ncbi:MAG: nucleotide exchange factor GrpE [Planctomycetaceae bacterium]|nr:nucleotide exchange factor GrpE [Planctomycetaceae bacterium]
MNTPEDHNDIPSDSESEGTSAAATPGDGESLTLEQQLEQAIAAQADAWDRFLRTQADLENYRKRVSREREEDRKYCVLPLVRDLLPQIDNLNRAIEACQKASPEADSPAAGLLQGVQMVMGEMVSVLGRYGTTPIKAEGEAFDPTVHEALQQVPSNEHPPMTVMMEYERGYLLHDRVIRPSKVIVSVAPPQASDAAE